MSRLLCRKVKIQWSFDQFRGANFLKKLRNFKFPKFQNFQNLQNFQIVCESSATKQRQQFPRQLLLTRVLLNLIPNLLREKKLFFAFGCYRNVKMIFTVEISHHVKINKLSLLRRNFQRDVRIPRIPRWTLRCQPHYSSPENTENSTNFTMLLTWSATIQGLLTTDDSDWSLNWKYLRSNNN